jgi:hypothetical protein
MNAGGRCEVGAWEARGVESWPIAARLVPWVVHEARLSGVRVIAAERLEDGGWAACAPEEIIERAREAAVEVEVCQRLGCGGLRTTLRVGDGERWWGACMAEVSGHGGEAAAWRVVLVGAMVRSG